MTDQSVGDVVKESVQMSNSFLDPQRPLSTCVAQNCEGCPVSTNIHCHFQASDLIAFLLPAFPTFLVGGAGIYQVGAWWLAPWLLLILGYFGFVEIRVMCSHCPHYAEPGKSLQCWANYGSPKLWKYRPGPMSITEKTVFVGGMALVWGYPLVFFPIGQQWFLLAIYLLTTASFAVTLRRSFCSHCMNFACPYNNVEEKVRQDFFKRNPIVAKAWGKASD
jgi:hypothetical protein